MLLHDDFRVACAVAQTNVGYGYICRTLNSLGIEPGTNCEAYVDGMKRKRDGDNTRKKSLKFKKRRNEIHTKRIHGRGLALDYMRRGLYTLFFPSF